MTNRARKGRYFPLALPSVTAPIRAAGLTNAGGKNLPVSLANPRPAQEREALAAELVPHRGLILYSLPDCVAPQLGVLLWQSVLDACVPLARRREPIRPGEGPVYAFLGGLGGTPPRIVARWYHFQTRKYRGHDKFTGSPDRRLLRVEEHPVSLPASVSRG